MANLTIKHINALDAVIPDEYACGDGYEARALELLKRDLCTSTNEHRCYGPLWECENCHQVFCCIEGDDSNNLCDSCNAELEANNG